MTHNRRSLFNNLYTQIILVYSVLIILPLVIILTLLIFKSMNDIENEFYNFMTSNNYQSDSKIEFIISDIDRISSIPIIDKEAQAILGKYEPAVGKQNVEDNTKIIQTISLASNLSRLFYEVVFVGNNDELYTNVRSLSSIHMQKIYDEWIPEMEANKNQRFISPVYKGEYDVDYITIYRKLLHSATFKPNAFVFVNIRLSELQRQLSSEDKGADLELLSNTVILHGKDIIYQSEENDEDASLMSEIIHDNWEEIADSHFQTEINDRTFMMTGTVNPETGWRVVQYIPRSIILSSMINNLRLTGVLIFSFMLLLTVIGYFISQRIIAPIHQMKTTLELSHHGRFEEEETSMKMVREIRELIDSYNLMVRNLHANIKEKYQLQLDKREMEFDMLRAQINPHFLFNTLNLINSLANLDEVENIKKVTNSLARTFEYSISSLNEVTIDQELQEIDDYIRIQSLRFVGKFEFRKRVASELLDLKVLKFIIQPIVENAINHGLKDTLHQGIIELGIEKKDSYIAIDVSDNGIGIEPDKLNEINQALRGKDNKGLFNTDDGRSHIGMSNIHRRIRNRYGEDYGLQLHSVEGEGTTVTILLPVLER